MPPSSTPGGDKDLRSMSVLYNTYLILVVPEQISIDNDNIDIQWNIDTSILEIDINIKNVLNKKAEKAKWSLFTRYPWKLNKIMIRKILKYTLKVDVWGSSQK